MALYDCAQLHRLLLLCLYRDEFRCIVRAGVLTLVENYDCKQRRVLGLCLSESRTCLTYMTTETSR
jgi:hypothetical protein